MPVCAHTLLRVLAHAANNSEGKKTSSIGATSCENERRDKDETGSTDSTGCVIRSTGNKSSGVGDRSAGSSPKQSGHSINRCNISDAVVSLLGSCLPRVAREIDLTVNPRGVMESILRLLLPSNSMLVREQAALALGAIASEAHDVASQVSTLVSEPLFSLYPAAEDKSCDLAAPGGCGVPTGDDVAQEKPRLKLWRHFCASLVTATGAQVCVVRCAHRKRVSVE